MVLPTPLSLALTLLLVAPFQWFTVAAEQYRAYEQRVGFLLLLPARR